MDYTKYEDRGDCVYFSNENGDAEVVSKGDQKCLDMVAQINAAKEENRPQSDESEQVKEEASTDGQGDEDVKEDAGADEADSESESESEDKPKKRGRKAKLSTDEADSEGSEDGE